MMRRTTAAVIAGIAAMGLLASMADARPGSGGSRGSKTHSAPPATNTAPGGAAPMQKSMTQPGAGMVKPGAAAGATAAAAQAARPSMMRNLLLGGLMGAGLAMMFGTGTFASVMGFLLQTLLIGGLIALAIMFFRRRFGSPAMATATPTPVQSNLQPNALNRSGTGLGGAAEPVLQLTDADFGTFERLLCDVQLAYGHNDLKALETRTTPEMLSYFAHELDTNRKKGVRNEIGNPKLLQGDLSEAWREGNDEYATVSMRYSITDATLDLASGRLVSGNRTDAQEVVEFWTFRRNRGADMNAWELSAIQQAA